MSKHVALLVGGWSAERQVSLTKGKEVETALKEAGYKVSIIDVKKDPESLIAALTPKPDVVFNNLHGTGGEDGTVQALLEMLELPYTHSGVTASAIGMDKPICSRLAASFGVKCPEHAIVHKEAISGRHVMQPPYVIKPPREGSSVGVKLILDDKTISTEGWPFGEEVMVEKFIPGRELTVAVLDGKAQGVTEITSQTQFFDYEAKYHDTRTSYVLPAKLPQEIYEEALKAAEAVYNGIGCRGLARCDFRYNDTDAGEKGLFFLEINTQPGLTAESIGPSQVIRNGMSFVSLCSHLVETATCQQKENQKQTQNKSQDAQAATLKRPA